jgi:hypothetical protein
MMRARILCRFVVALAIVCSCAAVVSFHADAAQGEGRMMVHNVYFSLQDNSAKAKAEMVAACKKFLTKHDGEVYFAAGTLAEEGKLRSSDRDFDVALVIVFKSPADLARFDKSERHRQFVAENKANWKKVRVFDALAEP